MRELTGEEGADALTVVRTEGAAPSWTVTVGHRDGRQWWVAVERGAAEPPRPESCGKALGSPARMDVTGVYEVVAEHPGQGQGGAGQVRDEVGQIQDEVGQGQGVERLSGPQPAFLTNSVV